MQGASPLASPGLNPRGTYRTCQAGARSGALPLAGRGWVAFRYPAVAWRFWSPACLLLELCFFPHPPAPLPGGKGETLRLFYARGFAPCIPGAEPGRHLQNLPSGCPEWGFAPCGAGMGGVPAPGGGRGGFGRPPAFYFSFVFAPIPPTPFPPGRGRLRLFSCKGLRPLHPRG